MRQNEAVLFGGPWNGKTVARNIRAKGPLWPLRVYVHPRDGEPVGLAPAEQDVKVPDPPGWYERRVLGMGPIGNAWVVYVWDDASLDALMYLIRNISPFIRKSAGHPVALR
jgi:hypothetical protein